MLAQLPEEAGSAVIVVKTERPTSSSRLPNGKGDPNRPKYDPAIIYILELATVLTLRDRSTLEELGESLAGCLQTFVRDARNLHPLAIARILFYLLQLLGASYVR